MAGTLKYTSTLLDTDPFSAEAPITKTVSISYTSKLDQTFSLTTTDVVTVWDITSVTAPVADFDAAYFLADGDCDVELGANTDDTSTDAAQFCTHRLTTDAALFIGADDSYGDHTTDAAFGATLDTTDRIRLLNPTTGTTVNVRVILVT